MSKKGKPEQGNMAASALSCGTCGSESHNILRGYCNSCEKIHLIARCSVCSATINLASADMGQDGMEFADITQEQLDSMKNFIVESLEKGVPVAAVVSARSGGFFVNNEKKGGN